MIDWLIMALLGIGLFFNFIAVLGLHRFPDVYTRLHASTKCNTFGSIFLVLAVVVYGLARYQPGPDGASNVVLVLHSVVALLALLITHPTSSHAISRASHISGYLPIGEVDKLEEDKEEK